LTVKKDEPAQLGDDERRDASEDERRDASEDERWMDRALSAARHGRPSPNPHVGAVVVKNGKLLGVGHHVRAGQAHAEVMALHAAGAAARGATLYVTLGPCNHQGRTGPCATVVLASGVARVVVGCPDPTPGRRDGTARLKRGGLAVTVGVRRAEARALIADYAKHVCDGLPYVTLKAAVSLDGRLATRSGDSRWLTGPAARREAHRLRAASDAVLIGIGTALADDPALTVRGVRGHNPVRVVLDSKLRLPPGSQLARTARRVPTWVVHGAAASAARRARLAKLGVELIEAPVDRQGRLKLRAALQALAARDLVRVLVEGGGTLHGALLDAGLADEAAVFVAPCIVGDARAVPLAAGQGSARLSEAYRLRAPEIKRLGPDTLIRGVLDRGSRRG
jgi:diaminohydroxyphosphoribosylaminopyrimidine deaminase/5-amino-6-(5-phosphoribosylamino)uracil reductase